MKDVIIFDFDNTLYSHQTKTVPQSAKNALRTLKKRGNVIILATGRGRESLEFIEKEAECVFDAYIFLNGQIVTRHNETLFEENITLSSMEKIIGKANNLQVAYGGISDVGEVVNTKNNRIEKVWLDFNGNPPQVIADFERTHKLYHGHLYITESEEKEHFIQFEKDFIFNRSHEFLLNIIDKKNSKSKAIKFLLQYFEGYDKTIAFGDAFNDIDMLQTVDIGIAMGIADEKVKKFATFTTENADDDGIEIALKKLNKI